MNIINRFTLQTLKQNRVRTLVTIIGILLSTAMFTAVTSIVVSLQQYLLDIEIETYGAWEGRVNDISDEQLDSFLGDKRIKDYTVVKNVGYALVKDSLNEDKPYLCVESIESNFTDMSPIKLIKGRMPRNDSEVVISKHLSENGGVTYQIGDTLTLDVGKRRIGEGIFGGQSTQYLGKDEELADTVQKKYQVVGICERPNLEDYSAPGYTCFTVDAKENGTLSDVLFQTKDPLEIDKILGDFVKKQSKESGVEINTLVHSELLRIQGKSTNENYMSVLTNMGIILIAIIMAASISLIYNAFSISISERTKQFGLLKSIGATKKQIRRSVLFEAFSLCIVGIPLGVGSGLLGIGITLHFVGKLLQPLITEASSLQLELTISWWAILAAVVVAVITVLISAMIPARRAVKMPAIQALRESNEIRLSGKKLRTSKFVYRFFGFEGMLANKNFKRNRRKHRMTVISLAVSVILFLGTSSFSNYMVKSMSMFEEITVDDISFSATKEELNGNSLDKTKKILEERKAIDKVAYSATLNGVLQLDIDQINEDYLKQLEKYSSDCVDRTTGKAILDVYVTYIEDETYKKYLEEKHLDVSRFMDSDKLCPLVWATFNGMREEGGVCTMPMLAKDTFQGALYYFKDSDKYWYNGEVADLENMTLMYDVGSDESEEPDEAVARTRDEALAELSLADAKITDGKLPLGATDMSWNNVLNIMLPYSAMEKLPEGVESVDMTEFQIQARNHTLATEELTDFFQNNNGYSASLSSHINDKRASEDAMQAMILIINIFSYGFITLITLIVVANVFNTISTNIQLRRKEFAMLKSVGMTRKGFDRMMNYECILYGVKGLLFGLPISFVLCYLMYKSLQEGWNASLMIPWGSVFIVVVSVFIIVFASMLYSMSKIKKDNPIDALRNDNL